MMELEDDGSSKPEVCVFSEKAGDAIVAWGKAAIEYLIATQVVVEILVGTFESRRQMELAGREIKYYLRKSLSSEDQEMMIATDSFKGDRNQSPAQKAMIKRRTTIINRLKALFQRLLNEAFPNMIPMMEVSYAETITKSPSGTTATPKEEKDSVVRSLEPVLEAAVVENESVAVADSGQKTRPKFQKSSFAPSQEQDLFETPAAMLSLLDGTIAGLIEHGLCRAYEPCHGNGAISDYLKSKGMDVTTADLYTLPTKTNFLTDPIPTDIDVIITNPPFCLKHAFLKKCVSLSLPFILLLTIDTMVMKKSFDIFSNNPFDLIVANGKSEFLHAGRMRQVGACGWFLFLPTATGQFSVKQLGAVGDIEDSEDIEDEDSEDIENTQDKDDDDSDFEG